MLSLKLAKKAYGTAAVASNKVWKRRAIAIVELFAISRTFLFAFTCIREVL